MKTLRYFLFFFLFGCYTVNHAQMRVRATMDHIASDNIDSDGSVTISVSGGSPPFIYSWSAGIYPNNKDRVNAPADKYTLKVKDINNDSVLYYYNLGFKNRWTDFNGTLFRNDSLLLGDNPPLGQPTALSINTLRSLQEGWIELVMQDLVSPYLIGFTSSQEPSLGDIYDIDFGFHLTYGNYLYAWSSGNFIFLGQVISGDVIKIAREDNHFYLMKNNINLYSTNADMSHDLRVKSVIGNDLRLDLGSSFADSTTNKSLNLLASADHVSMDGIDPGKIILCPSGGSTPYSYKWSPINSYSKDLKNVNRGSYRIVVKDNKNDSLVYHYKVGYKTDWTNFNGTTFRNDSLLKEESPFVGIRSAMSINKLPSNAQGWSELIIREFTSPYLIGFVDNASGNNPGLIDDVEFAFHVTNGNALYSWSGGFFNYLGSCAAGDVMRIERTTEGYALYKNNVVIATKVAVISKQLRLKVVMDDELSLQMGSSFTLPLSVDFNKSNILSNEEANSAYIFLRPKYGTPPYSYKWSDNSTNSSLTDLGIGNYSVTVKDSLLDSVRLSFLVGSPTKFVNLTNMYRQNENEFVKSNSDKTSMANINTFIPAGGNEVYELILNDNNTNFNFVLSPYDTITGLQSQSPVSIRQSIVVIPRSQLPSINTSEYLKINFADTITTGETANVIQKEFVSDTCLLCDRLNLSGIQIDYGTMYTLRNGVTIQKGVAVENGSILRLELSNNQLSFYNNSSLLSSGTLANINPLIANLTLKGPKVDLSPTNGSGGHVLLGPSLGPNPGAPSASEGCPTCVNDTYRNYSETIFYDELGVVVSQVRSYTDYFGKSTQTQVRNVEEKNILASQILYDIYGRSIGATLPAPINSYCFCYKSDFVKNQSNTIYSYNDFDVPNNSSSASLLTLGEKDKPKPLANNVPGTLGWYYSNSNTIEKYVPTAETPYSKIDYSYVDPSSTLRASKPGYNLNSGSGHETYTFKMATMGELGNLFGSGYYWRIDGMNNFYGTDQCLDNIIPAPLLNTAPLSLKSINVDENGIESVSFMDLTGNIIAKCLSGKVNGTNVKTQTVASWLSFKEESQMYLDIHLPEGCENSLSISTPPACPSSGSNIGGVPTFNFVNLKTGKLVWFGGGINSYDFQGTNPVLPAGYYRIIPKYKPWCMTGVTVVQNLNYYNFSLYYYDYANRLKALVSPKGFDDSYVFGSGGVTYQNPNRVIRTITSTANQPANFPEGKTWSINSESFSNTIPLNLGSLAANSSKQIKLKLLFNSEAGYAIGENPSALSSDERSRLLSTSWANYESRTYLNDSTIFETVSQDTFFVSSKDVDYKIKVAITNAENNVIEETIQENYLRCNIQYARNGTEYKTWYPVSFNFHKALENKTAAAVNADWNGIKILELHPTAQTLGEDLTKYGELINNLKITGQVTSVGNGKPSHKMIERYRYNSWSEVQTVISPDEGQRDFIYSNDGKLRFAKNAKQVQSNASIYLSKFNFTDYDEMNRPIAGGEYVPPSSGINAYGVPNTYYYFEKFSTTQTPFLSGHNSLTDQFYAERSMSDYLNAPAANPSWNSATLDENFAVYDCPDPNFWTEVMNTSNALSLSTFTQRHLSGRLSYNYNNNRKTWYSYDEQGRIEWVVQKYYAVNAPGATADVRKSFKYKYDFFGNVTEVIYNEENALDRFRHYYEYDQNKRLKRVYTSRGSASNAPYTKVPQAKYDYYLHGPIKRVELADRLQGIDFIYTINGWLKSNNAPEMQENWDPGKDGYASAGISNTCYKDIFGYSLEYFHKDYERAGTYVQSYSDGQNGVPFAPDKFNGTIKAQRWQTRTPLSYVGLSYQNQQLMFGYQYDKKYQLKEANFATITQNGGQNEPTSGNPAILTSLGSQDYRVSNLSYDYNGNILSLKRNAYATSSNGINLDDLSYNYYPCSNMLSSVSDAVSANPYNTLGFKSGQASYNYGYSLIGELAMDNSNAKMYEYNSFGNVTAIKTTANSLIAEYQYDEMGYRIKKTTYLAGGMKKYTLYIRDLSGQIVSTFEKTASSNNTNFGAPSEWNVYAGGRVGILDNTAGAENYVYELSDHLGNVRATFKKSLKNSIASDFNLTSINDDNWFKNTNSTLVSVLDSYVGPPAGISNFVRVQKTTNKEYGAGSKMIQVKNGNSITLSWKALWETGTVPLAGMEVKLTDVNGNLLPGTGSLQYFAMTSTGGTNNWQTYTQTFNITANYPDMYLSFYPRNKDNGGKVAYFDNFSLSFNSGGVSQPDMLNMADYYPHGSVMPGLNYNTSYKYKYGYQGQFAEMDEESNENFFDLRNYNPLLGRFNSADPYGQYHSPYLAMGNSHPNMVDRNGGLADWHPDGNGNLIADAGDSPLTLAAYLGISVEDATGIYSNYSNWDGGLSGGLMDVTGHVLDISSQSSAGAIVGAIALEGNIAAAASAPAVLAAAAIVAMPLVLAGDEPLSKRELSDNIYYHYTNSANLGGIVVRNLIFPDEKNRVFLTKYELAPIDVLQRIFLNNEKTHGGKEHFVIAFRIRKVDEAGLKFNKSNPLELEHTGTLRLRQIIYAGPNTFKTK